MFYLVVFLEEAISWRCFHWQDKKLKELYEDVPTLEELHALELEGLRADIILVDAEKDRKLSMLKQLIIALVKGLNTNTPAVIKKIAGLVSIIWSGKTSFALWKVIFALVSDMLLFSCSFLSCSLPMITRQFSVLSLSIYICNIYIEWVDRT